MKTQCRLCISGGKSHSSFPATVWGVPSQKEICALLRQVRNGGWAVGGAEGGKALFLYPLILTRFERK